MSNEILFTERQRIKLWWVWVIFLCVDGFFLFGVFKQVINGQQFGSNPMSNAGLLFMTGLMIAFTLFIASIHLDTIIKKDGIYVRFSPFHTTFKHYTWDKLTKTFVRQYSPIIEYSGWGLRVGLWKTAFTTSGNKGLQLEFTDNKTLLIGTHKPDELTEALNKIEQLKQ